MYLIIFSLILSPKNHICGFPIFPSETMLLVPFNILPLVDFSIIKKFKRLDGIKYNVIIFVFFSIFAMETKYLVTPTYGSEMSYS